VSLEGTPIARTTELGAFNFTVELFGGRGVLLPDFFLAPFSLNLLPLVEVDAPDTLDWNGTATIAYRFESVPEPMTLMLLATGLTLSAASRRFLWG
jgi:hypothetical protein